MKEYKVMQLITAIAESVFAIPILGGLMIVASFWMFLIMLLALHIISLIFCVKAKKPKYGNIVGIVGSVLGIIPLIGWAFHITAAILLWMSFSGE